MKPDTFLDDPRPPKLGVEGERIHDVVAARLFGGAESAARIGRFTVIGRVGQGGMGEVFAAYDPQLDRRVALKLLRPGGRPERLAEEARTMAQLSHPNIVPVFEVGLYDESVFVAMEFVEGQTLRAWAAQRPPWREVVAVYRQAGAGLSAAHAAGIVHRDFKPDNVLLGNDGRVRVVDFGLARAAPTAPTHSDSGAMMTPVSAAGTPAYVAPEQALGEPPDARADQFAFAVAFYETLYGVLPFAECTPVRLIAAAREAEFTTPPKDANVPAWIRDIVVRGLAADPDERFPSMGALLAALDRDPARRRRTVVVGVGVGLLGAVVAAILTATSTAHAPEPCPDAAPQIEPIWSERRAQALRMALRQTDVAFADEAAETVRLHLDRYAADWIAEHRDACEATYVRHEQSANILDARMRCLHGRKRALAAFVEVFSDADASMVAHAATSAPALPAIELCSRHDYVTAVAPPPEDAEVAARVTTLEDELARVRAMLTSGKHQRGVERARRLVEQAEATGHEPLVAAALGVLGHLESNVARADAAETHLREAYFRARAVGDTRTASLVAARLALVLVNLRDRVTEARDWARHGLVDAERNDDPGARASGHNVLGIAATLSGDQDEALRQFERSLELRRQAGNAANIAAGMGSLSQQYLVVGRIEEADRLAAEGILILERELGPHHPAIGLLLLRRQAIASQDARYADARAYLERALAITVGAYGEVHPDVGRIHFGLAEVASDAGDLDVARSELERVLEIYVAQFGESGRQLASVHKAVGFVELEAGEPERALERFERSGRILAAHVGADHHDVGALGIARASALIALRRFGEAKEVLEAAHSVLEGQGAATSGRAAEVEELRAKIIEATGEAADAERQWEAARLLRERVHGADSVQVADPLLGIARARLARNRAAEAVEPAERAVQLVRDNGVKPHRAAEAQLMLARALAAAGGHPARARELARAAAEGFAAGPPPARARAIEARTLLQGLEPTE